ncbi:MAG: histidine kinase, partial [Verrucomicrobia bacterium]
MPIITIYQGASGEGQELAETVAQALGYRCVGREVLVETSRR